jgi:hypothetical protein
MPRDMVVIERKKVRDEENGSGAGKLIFEGGSKRER